MFDMVMLIGSLGIILVYCIADMAITVQNNHQVSAVKIVSIQISDYDDTITYLCLFLYGSPISYRNVNKGRGRAICIQLNGR